MVQKRKTYHHGDLRTALLDKAIQLLRDRGGPFFSMRDLASDLGVSHSASYRHFNSKDALLQAIAIEGFLRLAEFQKEAVSGKSGALPRLRQLGTSYVRFALKYPEHFRVMFGPTLADRDDRQDLGSTAHKTFLPVVEGVTQCQKAKKFKAGNAEMIALTLWSSVHGLAMLLIDGQIALAADKAAADPDTLIDTLTSSVMQGFET